MAIRGVYRYFHIPAMENHEKPKYELQASILDHRPVLQLEESQVAEIAFSLPSESHIAYRNAGAFLAKTHT
jgi:hypothetical protein